MKLKKVMATLIACGLVGGMIYGGTLAYFTDNESHTNTVMLAGNIKIDLEEPNWNQEDANQNGVPDAAEDVVPNQEIQKDPLVKNTGDNPAFTFLRISVPVKDVTRVDDSTGKLIRKDGSETPVTGQTYFHEPQDLFYFKSNAVDGAGITTHANKWNPKWIQLDRQFNTETKLDGTFNKNQVVGQAVYVFGYEDAIGPNSATETLFDRFQIKNIIENEITADEIQSIKVEAFAIQADNVLINNTVVGKTGLQKGTLEQIYDIFVNQNVTIDNTGKATWNKYVDDEHGQTEKEADINNAENLKGDKQVETKLSLKTSKVNLKVDETATITTTITRTGTDTPNVTYKSSNPEVAEIVSGSTSASGCTVKAKKIGDTTITAEVDGVKAAVHISVMNDSRDPEGNIGVDVNDQSPAPNGTTQP